MILFKDILTFLRFDYRDASLILLYSVVLGINIQKTDRSYQLYYIKIGCKKS